MFTIDFSASEAGILSEIQNRDIPAWAIPVFDFIKLWHDENVDTFAVHTSGSTGTPKIIYHSRKAMIASAEKTCGFFRLKKADTALLALPAAFIGGKMMIVRSAMRGLKLICVEPKSNPLFTLDSDAIPLRDCIADTEIDFAAFTPMQMSMILAGPGRDLSLTDTRLSHIKTIILGGGEVSYPLRQKLQDISPSVYETYGMTETISHIALKKLNGADRSDFFTVVDGVGISVDDRECLLIHAPYLSDATIITNDLVKIISGKEFQWLGRYDNIINTGGIKVSAEEIERKLQPYVDANFFVAGIADDVLGQRVVLLLEGREDEIKTDYKKILSKYENPKEVLIINKFVYTENGKINKKETIQTCIKR
jgi:O-succinylbenzoic acid--CoA ligase